MQKKNLLLALTGVLGALASSSALAADDKWQITVGAGAITRPEYPGSSDNKTQAVPFLNATYGRYFIGSVPGTGAPVGAGAYLYQDDRFRFGAAIGGDFGKPREESDNDKLRGLGDIDATARAGLFASYTVDRFTLRGSVFSDIGGKDQGTVASMDLEARFMPVEGLLLTAGPGLTWANKDYTQTFFGVDAEQSARSGLPVYDANSGISSVRFSLGANYRLNANWGVAARFTNSKLRNDAADSPITEDKKQNSFGLFATYRF
jgi:MipA family protein